jgi:hypothetical protein
MSEADHSDIANARGVSSPDFNALIASLRTAGADQFDPVRLHYIESLVKRGGAHHGNAKRMLDDKLAQTIVAFKVRFEQSQSEAREFIAQTVQQFPHAADDLQQFFDAGNFKGLKRFAEKLTTSKQGASLGSLLRQLEQHSSHSAQHANARLQLNTASRPELKTIRNFRNTWAKLSVEKQVTQALEHAPKNAGPINSHMLVLRSLALMRDISPDYLNRFMSYADTLLCLEQGEKEKLSAVKKSSVVRSVKK